jgi:hypothetical protein
MPIMDFQLEGQMDKLRGLEKANPRPTPATTLAGIDSPLDGGEGMKIFWIQRSRQVQNWSVICFALLSLGCPGPSNPPEHTKRVNLQPQEVQVISIPGMGQPRLEVSADHDLDLALIYAEDPITDLSKVVSQGRIPKRYQGRNFRWLYTGIEKDMKLLLQSSEGATVVIRYTKPLLD